MNIDTSKIFQELKVNGNTFGGVKYFDSKRRYTVFSLCPSGSANVDCDGMVKKLGDLIKKQADVIKEDFKSAKGDMFNISDSARKEMSRFIDSLHDATRKVGGTFTKSDLTQYLDEYSSPSKNAKRGSSKPRGKSGAELCSSRYREEIRDAIFGSSRSSRSFSSAIEDDVKKIASSIYDDLQDSLSSIHRVSESHKKSMIDAMQTFRNIVSGSRAVEVIGLLNYTVELTLPLPEQSMFSREKPSLKPIIFTSKELIKGHQDFEEYLRRNREVQFHAKMRYITSEYVERYISEISRHIKAALVLDTDASVMYIVLHVDEKEVFRTQYKDISYKSYLKDGSERLHVGSLKCKAFSDEEVASTNRENWNDNIDMASNAASWAGSGAAGISNPTGIPKLDAVRTTLTVLGTLGQVGQIVGSFKLSRDKLWPAGIALFNPRRFMGKE
jgi:hypothetical protein